MDYNTLIQACAIEEQELVFSSFTQDDAIRLGMMLVENGKKCDCPTAYEIVLNGMVVFRAFPNGTTPNNELWLKRKRNVVELMRKSSLRCFAEMERDGVSFSDMKLNDNDYAAGGGFPIQVKGAGVIGCILVSGFPDHMDDHRLLISTVREYLGK